MKQIKVRQILDKSKQAWEEIADEFSKSRENLWPELSPLTKYVKDNNSVLDLGCGNGRVYDLFKHRNIKYTGIDKSAKLIAKAKQRIQASNANFIVGDALNMPFKQSKFDVIFSIAFLHHIPTKKLQLKTLNDCYNILKPGGIMIISVWNFWQINLIKKYKIWQIFLGQKNILIPFTLKSKKIMRYYYVFRFKEFQTRIKSAGFLIFNKKKSHNFTIFAKKK
ncbi:class I SAM-dependent methyltransferase [Patescibacteria group bacterium]|nr:class I SAM-dependent methyltransferase [Patescibacteria group bacterium]